MQVTICDICGTKENIRKVQIPYNTELKQFDLCCKCYLSVLKETFNNLINTKKLNARLFNNELVKEIEVKMIK